MKVVIKFRPKQFLMRDEFCALAWMGKLVIVEGWDKAEAALMACSYYDISDYESVIAMFDHFVKEKAFTEVKVPNRIKKSEITQYLRDRE